MTEYDTENGYQTTDKDPWDWKENFDEQFDSLLSRFDKTMERGKSEIAKQILVETETPAEGTRDTYWGTNSHVADIRDKMDKRQYELQKKRMEMQEKMAENQDNNDPNVETP